MREFFLTTFADPMRQLYSHLASFFPRLLAAASLILLGLLLAWIFCKLIRKSLLAIHFDRLFVQMGLAGLLERSKIQRQPIDLLASGIYWLICLNFFMIGIRTLDEPVMSQVFSRFFAYLPNLLVSILILMVGLIFSKFISRSVLVAATNAQLQSARILSIGAEILFSLFTLSLALEQLGIGKSTIVAAFSIVFGGVVLALALAFGLGGRDLARNFLEQKFLCSKDSPGSSDKNSAGRQEPPAH
jgi:hypothetical protein